MAFEELVRRWCREGATDNERTKYKKNCEKIVNNHIIRYHKFHESPLGKSRKYKFRSHYFVDLKEATLTAPFAEVLAQYTVLKVCDSVLKGIIDKDKVKIAAHNDGNIILAWLVARYLRRPLSVFYSTKIPAKEEWEIDGNPADLPKDGDAVLLIHDVGWAQLDVMNACTEYARRGIGKLVYFVFIERKEGIEDSMRLQLKNMEFKGDFYYDIVYDFMDEVSLEEAWKKSEIQRRKE